MSRARSLPRERPEVRVFREQCFFFFIFSLHIEAMDDGKPCYLQNVVGEEMPWSHDERERETRGTGAAGRTTGMGGLRLEHNRAKYGWERRGDHEPHGPQVRQRMIASRRDSRRMRSGCGIC